MPNFFEIFRIESRSDYFRHDSWLVVYNKTTGEYVKEGRAFKRFYSSDEIDQFFKEENDD